MANTYVHTPCKNDKYKNCKNYQIKCNECTQRHGYNTLLVGHNKDYYIIKKDK